MICWSKMKKDVSMFKGTIVVLLLVAILVSLGGTYVVLDKFSGNSEGEGTVFSSGGMVSGSVGFTIIDPTELGKEENETTG